MAPSCNLFSECAVSILIEGTLEPLSEVVPFFLNTVFWNHQLFTVRRSRQFILRWGTANKIEQCITCYIFCKQKVCLLVLQNETGFSISVMIWQRTVRPLVLPILRWHHNTCNSLLVVPNIQLQCFPTTMLPFFLNGNSLIWNRV